MNDFTMDSSELTRAVNYAVPESSRTMAQVVDQTAYNVASRAFDHTNPQDVPGTRAKVKAYLNRQIAQKVRMTAKGKFVKRGKKSEQLILANLILQARRKKEGKAGLFGDAMTAATAEFARVSQISVGFLKSVYLPILMTLKGLVKFKKRASDTKNIARWPGSAGYGTVNPAQVSGKPFAILQMVWKLHSGQVSKVATITTSALQRGMNEEAAEMIRHVDEKLGLVAKKVSVK